MKLRKVKFFTKDDGAVTVDWVVLCAAVVALASLVTAPFADSADVIGDRIPAAITN